MGFPASRGTCELCDFCVQRDMMGPNTEELRMENLENRRGEKELKLGRG